MSFEASCASETVLVRLVQAEATEMKNQATPASDTAIIATLYQPGAVGSRLAELPTSRAPLMM